MANQHGTKDLVKRDLLAPCIARMEREFLDNFGDDGIRAVFREVREDTEASEPNPKRCKRCGEVMVKASDLQNKQREFLEHLKKGPAAGDRNKEKKTEEA